MSDRRIAGNRGYNPSRDQVIKITGSLVELDRAATRYQADVQLPDCPIDIAPLLAAEALFLAERAFNPDWFPWGHIGRTSAEWGGWPTRTIYGLRWARASVDTLLEVNGLTGLCEVSRDYYPAFIGGLHLEAIRFPPGQLDAIRNAVKDLVIPDESEPEARPTETRRGPLPRPSETEAEAESPVKVVGDRIYLHGHHVQGLSTTESLALHFISRADPKGGLADEELMRFSASARVALEALAERHEGFRAVMPIPPEGGVWQFVRPEAGEGLAAAKMNRTTLPPGWVATTDRMLARAFMRNGVRRGNAAQEAEAFGLILGSDLFDLGKRKGVLGVCPANDDNRGLIEQANQTDGRRSRAKAEAADG